MRSYGLVPVSFWTDLNIMRLSERARMLALYLQTSSHTTMLGCFRLPDGYVCTDLQWDAETVTKLYAELSAIGFVTRDEPSNWVLVRRFLKANKIENP